MPNTLFAVSEHGMQTVDMVLYPERLTRTDFAMIGLHGRNANKYAFFPFVRQMGFLHTQWFLPSAPFADTQAPEVRWWFDREDVNIEQIDESRSLIHNLIGMALDQHVLPENIFLVGFSQGAVMAIDAALRYPLRLGGIVALSGYVAHPELLAEERHPSNLRIPIFLGHGLRDTVLPVEVGRKNLADLAAMGYAVEFREYDTGHRISSSEVKDIRAFLHRHMYGYESDDPRMQHEHIVQF